MVVVIPERNEREKDGGGGEVVRYKSRSGHAQYIYIYIYRIIPWCSGGRVTYTTEWQRTWGDICCSKDMLYVDNDDRSSSGLRYVKSQGAKEPRAKGQKQKSKSQKENLGTGEQGKMYEECTRGAEGISIDR